MTKKQLMEQQLRAIIAQEVANALKEGPMPINNAAAAEADREGPVEPQLKGLGSQRSKVERIFTQLNRRGLDKMLSYLNNDIEKAQAIMKFASMVGVPAKKIPQIISNFRSSK
jgi:hypothetical protein